jgi:hypothetical protein
MWVLGKRRRDPDVGYEPTMKLSGAIVKQATTSTLVNF